MSLEDQHEWLEARRVTLLAQLELVLAAEDDVPAWLLTEWTRLQRARDSLLRHRLCQVRVPPRQHPGRSRRRPRSRSRQNLPLLYAR